MSFEEQIRKARHVVLFLDFDGTLAPIVPRPTDAQLPSATRLALQKLTATEKFTVAFVSGRSAADLAERASFHGAIYTGNHGLEISGAGLHFELPEDPVLRETINTLQRVFREVEGLEVEDKRLSASVHFRRVPPSGWARIEEAVRAHVAPELQIRPGKMVFEIRPAIKWNKGSAVLWILDQLHLTDACHVYIGDDLTDEDAFAALPDGITIHVGTGGETAAKYRLRNTSEVGQLLERLANDR